MKSSFAALNRLSVRRIDNMFSDQNSVVAVNLYENAVELMDWTLRADAEMQGTGRQMHRRKLTPEEREYEAMVPCRRFRCYSASKSSSALG
jgi:hypothetical protein